MSKATEPDLRYIANRLPKTDDPYLPLFSKDEISRVRSFHRSFPQYAVTPLADLRHMAEYLGVARVAVKDESWRFGLNSFKVLGGSYAIGRFLAREMGMDISDLTYDTLVSDEFLEKLGSATFIAATDGNHGRGVAWTARELRQRCIVLMPKGTTQSRFDNIASLGAEVSIEDGNYDDCVRMAVEMAPSFEHGVIVQDTSWPGYTDIPTWIMQGYGVMADEAAEQFAEKPTHIFVQAGVGAMAGAVTGYFAALYPDDPPRVVVVEPDTADCMFRGAERGDGASVTVTGDMPSIMAGLSCGEPSSRTMPPASCRAPTASRCAACACSPATSRTTPMWCRGSRGPRDSAPSPRSCSRRGWRRCARSSASDRIRGSCASRPRATPTPSATSRSSGTASISSLSRGTSTFACSSGDASRVCLHF